MSVSKIKTAIGIKVGDWTKLQTKAGDKKEFPFWSTIFEFMKPYKTQLLLASFCSFLVGFGVALQPICIKWIIDSGFMRKGIDGTLAPASTRMHYALGFIGLYVFLSLFRVGVWTFGYRHLVYLMEALFCRLRGRFFRHVQGLCFRFHDQVTSGELFNYIMGSPINSMKIFLQQFSMAVPYQLVSFSVAVVALASFNWQMTLIAIGMICLIVYVNYRSKHAIREVAADFMKTESSVSKYIADMLRGSRAIKIHAMEDNVIYSFEYYVDCIRRKGALQTIRNQRESIKVETIHYMGMALLYGVGAYYCIYREMQLGTFFAFISSIGILMGPIMAMMQINLVRGNAEAGLERIMRVLQIQKSTAELPVGQQISFEDQYKKAKAENLMSLEMCNVTFSYDEESPVLKNLSCSIPDGQCVALVGPSGSGKSTFIALLQRLYDPMEGQIKLNGEDIKKYSLKELRAAFGVVSQAPFMFQSSILDNVKVTRPDASEKEVWKALEMAYADEFVREMPDKLHTILGESGFNLSGGQRQRLAIARAVLSNPQYYIFDEATSALDNDSEKRIQEAMDSVIKGHTTFIIAHRLSTIRDADRVLVFDKGAIVQDGSYDELAEQEGVFRELLRKAEDKNIKGF
jgi:ABC-type multidrug transport system fused ATPase/permease subunit